MQVELHTEERFWDVSVRKDRQRRTLVKSCPMDTLQLTYADYARFARMPLDEVADQCEVEAFHAHGPGGQGVNTSDSAVRMRHVPTGIVVTSRESRSQFRNRQLCLQKLRAEFERRAVRPKRRVKTRPTQGSQLRRLEGKKIRSQVKQLRGKVRRSNDD